MKFIHAFLPRHHILRFTIPKAINFLFIKFHWDLIVIINAWIFNWNKDTFILRAANSRDFDKSQSMVRGMGMVYKPLMVFVYYHRFFNVTTNNKIFWSRWTCMKGFHFCFSLGRNCLLLFEKERKKEKEFCLKVKQEKETISV